MSTRTRRSLASSRKGNKKTQLARQRTVRRLLVEQLETRRLLATWTVDDSGGADFLTIQAAINAAAPGDTINVNAGSYVEDLDITKDNLELAGAGAGTKIIKGVATEPWTSFPLATPNIDIQADGVSIHGFTIESPNVADGFYSSGMVLTGTGIEIYNNAFTSFGLGDGLNDDDGGGVVIQTYRDTVLGYESDISGLSIHDNTFGGTPMGGFDSIFINHTNVGTGAVTIANNTISGKAIRSVFTERSNVTIQNNTFSTTLAGAFSGVQVQDLGPTGDTTNPRAQSDVTIQGNDIGPGFARGLRIGDAAHAQVLSNIIVRENVITGNNGPGVQVRASAGGVTVTENSLGGNTGLSVENTDSGALDASANYYGVTAPAAVAALVSANVDYTPWLHGGTATTPGFDGNFTELTVDDIATQTGTTGIVQEGINLVTASTVNVAAGNYTEDLVIDQTLELAGANDAVPSLTVIKGVAMTASTLWPLVAPNVNVIANGVHVHGITFESPNASLGFYSSGMVIGGNNVEIDHNVFETASAPNLDDISQALQTWAGPNNPVPGADLSGLNIHDNTFTSFNIPNGVEAGYEAIYLNPTSAAPVGTATIQNNTLTGILVRGITTERSKVTVSGGTIETSLVPIDGTLDPGESLQGINVVGATEVTVSGVTVQGFSGFTQGVRARLGAGVTVTGATINDAGIGVLADGSGTQVKIESTNLTGNTRGIQVSGGAVVDAGGGSLGSAGNNVLTGYAAPGTYAVYNQNLAAQADVYAKNSNFGSTDETVIEGLVWDDTDDGNLSEVIFSTAVVEFSTATASDTETSGGNKPKLLVNGTLASPQTIDVTVTGGSATSGSDFTNTATVNIPAGTYDGTLATAVSIGLSITPDSMAEPNETIELTLANPSLRLAVGDANGDTTTRNAHTYTIIDDETVTLIIDDGDLGFAQGGFTSYPGIGYQSDVRYSGANSGQTAIWTFSSLVGGLYRVSATWVPATNRATNAPYTISDGGGTVAVNQEQAPNDFSAQGAAWEDLVVGLSVTDGTLQVSLTDVGADEFVIADAIRVERLILAGPEIQVLDGTTNITHNTDTVSFGTVMVGATATKTFTVKNLGVTDLTLGTLSIPAGFSLVSGPPVSPVAPGGSTTFQVGLDTSSTGTKSGQVSLANNDSDESPFLFNVMGTVVGAVLIVDNGDADYTGPGFILYGGIGYQSDVDYSGANSGRTATWTFNGLATGTYRVSATWVPASNRATNAPYTVSDGGGAVAVNQELAPNDFSDQGVSWEDLAASVTVADGTLQVSLTDVGANEYVIADAVRIELLPSGPDTTPPTANLADPTGGGTISQVLLNARGYLDVTFADTGGSGLDASTITDPGNELSFAGPGVGTAAPVGIPTPQGGNTYRYGFSGAFGTGAVNVTFVAGSFADQAIPANTNVEETESFTVVTTPAVSIIDNGDDGYYECVFIPYGGRGYQSDVDFAAGDSSGDYATWTFTGLAPGDYQVAITWPAHPNRATNAPFSIWDNTTQVYATTVNQELTPAADEVESGVNFQHLGGPVNIASGTLVVMLTDAANEFVIADAVRIELLPSGPDTTGPTANLTSPSNGATLDPSVLNAQGYLDVTFADTGGSGLDATTIDGDELSLGGAGVGTATLDGTATPQGGNTYRYGFSGAFVAGVVNVTFVAGSFEDVANNPNLVETESFTLETAPAVQILDDGDADFTAPGFISYGGIGYQSDVRYSAANSGQTATWAFSGLASGTYRVSATWAENPNRATNAPYTVSDGGGTVAVNQELAPNDFSDAGASWEDLVAGLSVTDGTLQVTLTDVGADEYVIADAIRIERLGPLHAASVGEPVAGATGLTEADLARVWGAAVGYWSATDPAASRLNDTQVVIADLPPTILGLASTWTQTVWLDADAAGYGWNLRPPVHRTLNPEPRTLNPEPYDLLTVLTHEFGHVLGYDDLDPLSESSSIMTGVLTPGTRRLSADAFFAELGLGRPSLATSSRVTAESGEQRAGSWDLGLRSPGQDLSTENQDDGLLRETHRSRVTRHEAAAVDEWFAEFDGLLETLDAEIPSPA